MNRREFAQGVVATGIATAVSAPALGGDEKLQQYEICKLRGHVPTAFGNSHGMITQNAVFTLIPDAPVRPYQDRSETPWGTCFYCGKQYRFVTNIEER